MLAIVLDEDQHSQKVLASLLQQLGYTQILHAHGVDELDFYCSQNLNRIRLIVSAFRHEEGLDLPISRITLKHASLNLTPLVFTTNGQLLFKLNFRRSRFSRIDSYIHRPFGIEALKDGIAEAHERRGSFRNVLLIYGKESISAIEATYRENNFSHWKETVFAENFADLQKKYQEYGFKLGGILFDSKHTVEPHIEGWLNRIRKDLQGSTLVIGVLGQDAKAVIPFRLHANIFFDLEASWETVLDQLSERLLHDWESKMFFKRAKEQLKNKNLKRALTILKNAGKKISLTWELLELQGIAASQEGDLISASDQFLQALKMNPCSPSPYLQLLEISPPEQRKELALKALEYCPEHPQIKQKTAEILK